MIKAGGKSARSTPTGKKEVCVFTFTPFSLSGGCVQKWGMSSNIPPPYFIRKKITYFDPILYFVGGERGEKELALVQAIGY